ncbi:MAG: radical SAM protein [Clostridiales bacterium]|nr:radical SAM protein [Clostridiales bacterium]
MPKKNIYLVQVGFAFDRALYFPCAVGALVAYALEDESIKNTYEFKDFIFRREGLDSLLDRLQEPYLVGFSSCIWNHEYNKALAQRIKKAFPDCIILFGGHNVPADDSLIYQEDYIDICMHGEGEEPFSELLKALPEDSLSSVPNITYRKDGQINKNKRLNFDNIENYPSSYLSGVFDKLIVENPDIEFLAVLESNRGCPFSCSYCDWCAGKAVRFFPLERVKAEIDWLAENKIEYCFGADANFGMFERDLEVVDYLLESKRKTGYPKVFRPCYAKNSDERVFEISKKLNSLEMDKGATLAYQTLSDEALTNVRRKNLTMDKFANLLSKYNAAGIPSYSELILGLPGETYESFSKGICELLEAGQHNSISVYHCEVLVNSEFGSPDYIKKHGIKVARVPFNHIHSANVREEVREYSNLVIATNTMSHEMWIKANLFSVCVQCFHNLGLLRVFAIYQYFENSLSYYDFYSKLLDFFLASKGSLVADLLENFARALEDTVAGKWMYENPLLGEITWFFEEGLFLEVIMNFESFWEEIMPFLKSLSITKNLLEELLIYQKTLIKLPSESDKVKNFTYDFDSFLSSAYKNQASPLKRKTNRLKTITSSTPQTLKDYAKELVWYGRRRGSSLRHPARNEMKVEYI